MEGDTMNLSVLFVEDDPAAREKVSAILARNIRTVYQAGDGAAGLALFSEHRPPVVITDIRMPGMNGLDMAKAIKAMNEDVQIIVTTAHNDTEFLIRAIDIGIDQYVMKPVNRDVLFRAVRKCARILETIEARKEAERALKAANEMLDQKVRERTADLAESIAFLEREIIERRQAEEAKEKAVVELRNMVSLVSRSQREWQETFDAIGDMISIHDANFTVLRANLAFAANRGKHPRDVVNKKCYEFWHGAGGPVSNCPHIRTLQNQQPATEEVRDPTTQRIFRVSTFPYRSQENDVIGSIHVARDITEEKEQEMRLIMSERLASLGQMAAGIAHEINNPLASVAGCAEGLLAKIRKGACNPDLLEEYLNIIREEAARCKGITTAMLSFARKSSYERSFFSVSEAIDKTVEIIGFQGRLKDVSIRRRYGDSASHVFGSPGELRQVLIIILTNALDAMEDRGSITIETGNEDGAISIRIRDDGPGMPAEVRDRIFDPFFTTKSEKGGTGLGLAIAHRIIQNHNGSIAAASEPGSGTTFAIRLPAAEQ